MLLRFFPGMLLWWSMTVTGQCDFIGVRRALSETLVEGPFRLHFDRTGEHAVAATDRNGNGLPDQVEDCLLQTRAAWLLWIEGLGFPNPLLSPRYEGVAIIDIHFLNRAALGSNGVAYDEIQRFGHRGDAEGTGSLAFDVATSVNPAQNLTPAHELFHLIQNGATYFKNRWFTEGTARCSEQALGEGGMGKGLRGRWPLAEGVRERLDEMAYDAAAQVWEPLIGRSNRLAGIPPEKLPSALPAMRYTDGSVILKDLEWQGWEILREVILALGEADDRAAKERGLERWSEEEQKAASNTPYLLETIETVLKAFGSAQ